MLEIPFTGTELSKCNNLKTLCYILNEVIPVDKFSSQYDLNVLFSAQLNHANDYNLYKPN
jgi:hypothetical protein